jgi:hypothetical protein
VTAVPFPLGVLRQTEDEDCFSPITRSVGGQRTSQVTAQRSEDQTAKRIVLAWPHSHDCSEQGPDACGQSHGQCTPERDAYCARRHTRAARARGQRTQKPEEQQ